MKKKELILPFEIYRGDELGKVMEEIQKRQAIENERLKKEHEKDTTFNRRS